MVDVGSIPLEIIREVAGDLQALKGRSILALFGIAIGTAAVIAMLHVGHNARAAALQEFEALGTDLVMMQPQSTDGPTPQVPVEAVLALPKQAIGIAAASAIVQINGTIRAGRSQIQATVLAATDGVFSIGNALLAAGRFTSDIDGFAPFAVLGAGVANEITTATGTSPVIGDKVKIDSQVLTVIGVLQDTPANLILNLDFNRSVIVPFSAARRLISSPSITNIAARLSPGVDDTRTAQAVTDYFQHHMTTGTMFVSTARQMIANIEEQMRIYALLLIGIGTVSLLVGGVGIMNVMLMSVMQRRQEIGLRQAIGARRKDIRLMFLCETLILSLIGSTIGTTSGYLAGWVFAQGSGWQFEPAPLAIPLGAGMALVVGLFFGIYPASRAAHLDPIAALRSE